MKGKPDTTIQITLKFLSAPTIERTGEGDNWERRYHGFHFESAHGGQEVTIDDMVNDVKVQLERVIAMTKEGRDITVQIIAEE